MSQIRGIKDVVDAELEGRTNTYNFRKNPTPGGGTGYWFDLSMFPGNPVPKFWFGSPLVGYAISQSADGGFFHGSNVSPAKKYLRKLTLSATATTNLPLKIILCDYLLYYPLIDEGTLDEQFLDNTQSITRYTDGVGVQAICVSLTTRTGLQSFYINYTNQDGVAGRISRTVRENAVTSLGVLLTSETNVNANTCVFIPLQDGDTGVRSIESVTMLGIDTGLFSLILVKPLVSTVLMEINAPSERDFLVESGNLPEIKDDAYLNLLCNPNGAINASNILADMKVIWSD